MDQGRFLFGTDENGNPIYKTEREMIDEVTKGTEAYENARKQVVSQLRIDSDPTLNRTFHVGDIFRQIASGNLGGALGEIMQPFGGPFGRWGAHRAEAAEAARERGGLRGRAGGMANALLSRALTPAALLGAQQLISRTTVQAQDTIRAGQVTGEGFGAGLASRWEGFRLAGSPFDMLDRRTAQQIVAGVRGKGFRGEFGKAMQDSLGEIVKDLGTD